MPISIPFGGTLKPNFRVALGAKYWRNDDIPYNTSSLHPGIGRPVSFYPTFTTRGSNTVPADNTCEFTSLRTETITPFDSTVISVNGQTSRAPSIISTNAISYASVGGYGPDFMTMCFSMPTSGIVNYPRLALFAGRYGPGQSQMSSPWVLQNIDIAPLRYYDLGSTIPAWSPLTAFSPRLGATNVSNIGFYNNAVLGTVFVGGRSVSLAFIPSINGPAGRLALVIRDPADLLNYFPAIGSGATGSVGIPAGDGSINYALRSTTTYGTGKSWMVWTKSRFNFLAGPGNIYGTPWDQYYLFEQEALESDTLTLENPGAFATFVSTGSTAFSCDVKSSPWGFIVSYPGNNTSAQFRSSFLLIKPDLSVYYLVECQTSGTWASTFVSNNGALTITSLMLNIDNNGNIFYLHPDNPTKVLVAYDLMAKLNLEIHLPALPPFSMPCVTPCMGVDGVITRT